jgi:hypothetical protein
MVQGAFYLLLAETEGHINDEVLVLPGQEISTCD